MPESYKEFTYHNLDNEKEVVRICVTRQNLSSVLNSPVRSTSRNIPIEPIPPARGLPRIEPKHFMSYLIEQRKRENAIKSTQTAFERLLKESKEENTVDAYTAIRNLQKTVPPLFFEGDFKFHDPEVLEYLTKNGLQQSHLQQEKYSNYLDLVEVELVHQISTQSKSFFQALSRLHHLRDEVTIAHSEVTKLRGVMRTLNQSSEKSFDILRILQKKQNMLQVKAKLELIKTVKEAQPTVQLLLSSNDYIGALDLIESTLKILGKELSGIQCVRNLGLQLKELVNVISMLMKEEFLKCAINITETSANSNSDYIVSLENELSPSIIGLMHLHKMHVVNEEYSTRAISEIQQVLKMATGALSCPGFDSNAALKSLGPSEFLEWIKGQCSILLTHLQRASDVHEIMNKILNVMSGDTENEDLSEFGDSKMVKKFSVDIVESYCQQILNDNQNLLYRICEACQKEIARILQLRSEQQLRMQLTDFASLYNCIHDFIQQSEKYTSKQCLSLRGTISTQEKAFIKHFHQSRVNTIALILDNENWAQAEVAQEFQDIVDSLFNQERPSSINSTGSGLYFVLVIENEDYCIVNSALMLLKILSEYLECVEQIPSLSFEIVNSMIEILKVWNSRACQLVLGAGAMTVANLKSITATNLTLTSRCLKFFGRIIPQLKEILSKKFPENQKRLLNDFDRVKHDYQQHYNEIIEKLKNLIKSRIDSCCKQLGESDIWKDDSKEPSNYMKNIARAAESLYKILFRLYPKEDLQKVFDEIFAMYNSSLVEHFSILRLSKIGKQRLYNDITFLIEHCSKFKDVEEQAESLDLLKKFYETQFGTI